MSPARDLFNVEVNVKEWCNCVKDVYCAGEYFWSDPVTGKSNDLI
jgi:hypothetical protein